MEYRGRPINAPCGFSFLRECFPSSESSYLLGFRPSLKTEQVKRATSSQTSAFASMSPHVRKQRTATIANDDEKLLAKLGYKQEFQRAFTPLEVYYVISLCKHLFKFPKRCSGSRLVSSDSCLLSRQSVSFSFTTLFTIRPQISLVLFPSKWRSGGDGLGRMFVLL